MAFWNRKTEPEAPTNEDGEPKVKCTYCGGDKFHEGPSGGMSTNILCANPDCRHWFNYHGGILPMDDLHRVEPAPEEKAKLADTAQLERDRLFAERMNIGAVDYREHGSIAVLRQRQLQTRWTYPKPEQVDEICGFIMAMTDEIRTLREKVAELTLMVNTPVVVIPASDMLEHRDAGGKLLGHVERYSAYGPGSITDAASYAELNSEFSEFYRGWDSAVDMILRLDTKKWNKLSPEERQQLRGMKKIKEEDDGVQSRQHGRRDIR